MTNKIQNTKLIHAKLKNGSYYKYVWLGNDNFSKMFETWDYESNQGKYKGLLDFDQKISYYFDYEEFKDQKFEGCLLHSSYVVSLLFIENRKDKKRR